VNEHTNGDEVKGKTKARSLGVIAELYSWDVFGAGDQVGFLSRGRV
jgi:hypothetical protein